ncbi:MAG TPA: DNA polymerase IV [Clostridia bacterium]|jgi:DNA polymerase-4
MDRVILHSDLNNFYASIECLYNPQLRNKPVAVCGDPELRHGIVLAKNYIAKLYGVKTGDVIWEARQKCPDIIIVKANFPLYLKFSQKAREIYERYTDQIESFGIDECWLDVTGSQKLMGSGPKIAQEISQSIKDELGVTVSIGVSWNKIYAKLGSDMKKPDAITVITRDNYKQKIFPLSADNLLYVGRATKAKLAKLNINTIGDIANADVNILKNHLGKWGEYLWVFANGLDDSPVMPNSSTVKSVGNSTTTVRDLSSIEDIKMVVTVLAESVARRLREQNLKGQCVHLGLQNVDMVYWSKQMTIKEPTFLSGDIIKAAMRLFENYPFDKPVRNVSISVSSLRGADYAQQLDFFGTKERLQKAEKLEKAIDEIRRRFGYFSISRATVAQDKTLTDLNPKEENIIHPYSYF